MAKFIFPMESILQIKLKLEDQAKAEYSIQLGILHQEEEKLENLKHRKQEIEEELKDQVSSELHLLRIRQLSEGIEGVKYYINLQKNVLMKQQHKVDEAREKMKEARKERKTYEKLKENAFEEFKKEINAEEQKEINELVSFRFGQAAKREG